MAGILTKLSDLKDTVRELQYEDMYEVVQRNIRPILVIGTALGIYWLMKKPSGIPPGPRWTLPIIGDLLSITDKKDGKDARLALRRLRKKYGDIYSVYFGPRLFIVINGYPLMKDAFIKNGDRFSERPYLYMNQQISKEQGIIFSSGKLWKDQRKFALETLREFGLGKFIMEPKIHEEIEALVDDISKKNGVGFDMCRLIQIGVSNIICSLVFGQRFEYTHKNFLEFLDRLEENFKMLGATTVVNFLPILRFLPGDPFNFHRCIANVEYTQKIFINPAIEEHIKNYDENNTNDFISCYLKELKRNEKEGTDSNIDMSNLDKSIADLFVAGTETTSTIILWAILYFLHYPKVYQRCYKEIQDVIGFSRLPAYKDKDKMPYFEAFGLELLRITNIVLVGVPHAAPEDTYYQGYFIPKDAIIIPNLDSVLSSDEVWGDANAFRPERFLDSRGHVIRREEWIPFSLGRRVCLGEALAKMEFFLFLTTLLQRFDFQAVDPNNLPPLQGEFGVTYTPVRYEVRAIPR